MNKDIAPDQLFCRKSGFSGKACYAVGRESGFNFALLECVRICFSFHRRET